MTGLGCRVQHGQHEITAGRGVDPRGPQDDRPRPAGQNCGLAGELARAIDAGWVGRVGLDIGRAVGAVEHEIGRDMDQRNTGRRAVLRQNARSVAIGAIGRLHVGLRLVDRGMGGGVDDEGWRRRPQQSGDVIGPVKIELRPPDPHELLRTRARHQRPGKLPAPAGHQNAARRQYHASHSASRGSFASLSDTSTSEGSTGQGSARSGSFHITPRSALVS